jgi:catechol 2,3-dioxygenase
MKPTLQLQSIHLRVSDLARSVDFYARQLGLAVVRQSDERTELAPRADAPPFLTLTADRAAARPPPDAAGLFHAALLFPDRAALGAWLRFAAENGVEFDGFSDHGVSEAIYFSDPDGHGLEFYVDRPREQWPFQNGELAMTTRPLDVQALLAAGAATQKPAIAAAQWGHLHLRVTDLARSEAFYRETLGVQLTQGSYPGARFLAADGYHHHVALNTWGQPRRPQPRAALGLVEATFGRTGEQSLRSSRDPDGISLALAPL